MESVVKKVERTITEEKVFYIAYDGTEFTNQYLCEKHEEELKRRAALGRDDVEINEAMSGCCPVAISGNENYEYTWVRPRTKEAADALQEAFQSEYSDDKFEIDQWMCIELDYDDNADLYSESRIKAAVQFQFNALGIKVLFNYAGNE